MKKKKQGIVLLLMLMHFGFFQSQLAVLSGEAKGAAATIEARLQLGTKLSEVVQNKDDALALFDLFRDEGYILTEHEGRFCVCSSLPWFPMSFFCFLGYFFFFWVHTSCISSNP